MNIIDGEPIFKFTLINWIIEKLEHKPKRRERVIGAVLTTIIFTFLFGYAIGSVSAEPLQLGIIEEDFENWNINEWTIEDDNDLGTVDVDTPYAYGSGNGLACQMYDSLDKGHIYQDLDNEGFLNISFRFKVGAYNTGSWYLKYLSRINLNGSSDDQITIRFFIWGASDYGVFSLTSKVNGNSQSYNSIVESNCDCSSWQYINLYTYNNVAILSINGTIEGNIICSDNYDYVAIGHFAGSLGTDWFYFDDVILEWLYEGYRYDFIFDIIKYILLIIAIIIIISIAFYFKSGWRR